MAFKIGRRIFFHLPIRNPTGPANAPKPFISEPARGPAVSGVSNHEGFVAVGGDPRLIADSVNRLNPMQQPLARRPKLYFFDESKKLNPFAIVPFHGRFG